MVARKPSRSGNPSIWQMVGSLPKNVLQLSAFMLLIRTHPATSRFREMLEGIEWNVNDTAAAQSLCPYETVSPKDHIKLDVSRTHATNSLSLSLSLRSPTATAASVTSSTMMNGLASNTPST